MHNELVLVDQSEFRQGQRQRYASYEYAAARLPLELLNGLAQFAAHEFRVPIDLIEGARDDLLFGRVDRLGEGQHPVGHPIGRHATLRRRSPRRLHHLVGDAAKEEGVGAGEVLGPITMQLFIRGACFVVAAAV